MVVTDRFHCIEWSSVTTLGLNELTHLPEEQADTRHTVVNFKSQSREIFRWQHSWLSDNRILLIFWSLLSVTRGVVLIRTKLCVRVQQLITTGNPLFINTLRSRQMAAIFQTIYSKAFSWMKMFEFRLEFHWRLFPRFQLTIIQHWFG